MNNRVHTQVQAQQKTLTGTSPGSRLLQRTCACGGSRGIDGLCTECRDKRLTLPSSRRGFEAPSALSAAQGNSPSRENVTSSKALVDKASPLGHDFSRIPIYSTQREVLQTKLTVNQPGDVYEQEADQVAEQVMRMNHLVASANDDEEQAKNSLMRKQSNGPAADAATGSPDVPPLVHDVLNSGGGQPLDTTTRAFMEPRFGHDFSQVRVHSNERAAVSARAVNALAYTVGRDVVFGKGRYTPETSDGRRLIAHELTHTIQQAFAASHPSLTKHLRMSTATETTEREAETASNAISSGESFSVMLKDGVRLTREPIGTNPPKTTALQDISASQSFEVFDREFQDQIGPIEAGLNGIPDRLITHFMVQHLKTHGVPELRRIARDAKALVDVGRKAPTEAERIVNYRKAGGLYQGGLIIAYIMQIEVNALIVAAYADALGTPSGRLIAGLEQFSVNIAPLAEAALTFDPQKMTTALATGYSLGQQMMDLLAQTMRTIGKSADLSGKVIKIANILTIAFNIYQIARTPTIGGGTGGSAPSLPAIGQVFGGGSATAAVAINTAALKETLQAIGKLIAIGAIDPAIVSTLGTLGGSTSSPIPELGKVEPLKMAETGGEGGATGGSSSSSEPKKFKIVEQEGNTRIYQVDTEKGKLRFIGDLTREGDTMHFKGVDIEGLEANKLGAPALRRLLSAFAKEIAEPGVTKVVIEGAKRTTGPVPGVLYHPWTIPVR